MKLNQTTGNRVWFREEAHQNKGHLFCCWSQLISLGYLNVAPPLTTLGFLVLVPCAFLLHSSIFDECTKVSTNNPPNGPA